MLDEVSVFCRHNRFMADCPICSKGTALDPARATRRRAPSGATRGRSASDRGGTRGPRGAATQSRGPHASAGPYEDGEGARYVVRLERVPGGLRLGEWAGSELRRRAPVLAAADLPGLIAEAVEALPARDVGPLAEALSESAPVGGGRSLEPGISRGRAGDFKEELRLEPLEGGLLRMGRWVMQPGAGWQLREAAPMLPAARYAEALADAAAKGALVAGAAAELP